MSPARAARTRRPQSPAAKAPASGPARSTGAPPANPRCRALFLILLLSFLIWLALLLVLYFATVYRHPTTPTPTEPTRALAVAPRPSLLLRFHSDQTGL